MICKAWKSEAFIVYRAEEGFEFFLIKCVGLVRLGVCNICEGSRC